MPKKAWLKPELIVLVRGKPEEAVLTNCKSATAQIFNATDFAKCSSTAGSCDACTSIVSS